MPARRPLFEPIVRLAPLLTVALAATLALHRLDNTDTWWHLAGGRWIVSHGRIPYLDPLSSTVPDHPWINLQWLFDVAIYGLERLGGPSLLVVVSALAYGAATALMLVNVRRHVGDVPTAVLGLWAVLVAQERFAIRPEMVTYLLLQVTLWLYATGRGATDRRLWLLPAVMALWVNGHALFVVGAVVVACQMAGTVAEGLAFVPAGWRSGDAPVVRRRILVTGVAALAATLLNPFGIQGAVFPLVLMGRLGGSHVSFRAVGEFQPPFSGYLVNLSIGAYQVLFVTACLAVAGALVAAAVGPAPPPTARAAKGSGRAARRRSGAPAPPAPSATAPAPRPVLPLADVAVFVGVAYLSLLARRNMALFAMAGLPCFARALAVLAATAPQALAAAGRRLEGAVAVTLVPVVLGFGWWVASNGFYRWNRDVHETGLGTLDLYAPMRAAAFVKAERLPGPWFNDLTTGGYFAWDPPIAGGVYVDGRLEVYEADFLDDYLRQLGSPARWQAEMDRRGVQTAIVFHWWGNVRPLVRYLARDPRWALVYYDQGVVVAVRREGNAEAIARARAAFRPEHAAIEQELFEPSRSWRTSIRRERGLEAYANLLDVLGKSDEARGVRARLADS